jgi:hypothetical protein
LLLNVIVAICAFGTKAVTLDLMDSSAEQARKFAVLKSLIEEGMADVEAGRVVPWDLKEFLRLAREQVNHLK